MLVNSSLVPQLESSTPPLPEHTIFGRRYNSSPLAQARTPSLSHRHAHTVAAPLTYFTARHWIGRARAHARTVFTEQALSRSVGHAHIFHRPLVVFLQTQGHTWTKYFVVPCFQDVPWSPRCCEVDLSAKSYPCRSIPLFYKIRLKTWQHTKFCFGWGNICSRF